MKTILSKLLKGLDLSEEEMITGMTLIMEGQASDAQIGSFLTALKIKGETVDEIVGGAMVMRSKAKKVNYDGGFAIDTCGTGGDGAQTFNISTAVAFVTAAAGVPVIKHGNRSVSSLCGSADVLEALNINIHLEPEQVKQCLDEINIGFMFAPEYHQAMKHAIGPRRQLGVRTIFNLLGPLTNPAGVKGQVLGVYDEKLTKVMAEALNRLGIEHGLVVHGADHLDEISITGSTKVSEVYKGTIQTYYVQPKDYGMKNGNIEDLQGGDAVTNANIILDVMMGKEGAARDIILLNAGAAIYVGQKASSIKEGIAIAEEMITTGKVLEKMTQLRNLSQEMMS